MQCHCLCNEVPASDAPPAVVVPLCSALCCRQAGKVLRLRKAPRHKQQQQPASQQHLPADDAGAEVAALAALEALVWQPLIPEWTRLGETISSSSCGSRTRAASSASLAVQPALCLNGRRAALPGSPLCRRDAA